MESGGGSGAVVLAKIDPCGACGKRAKVNCVRCRHVRSGFMRGVLG